jgi:hypothetical protein
MEEQRVIPKAVLNELAVLVASHERWAEAVLALEPGYR